MRSLRDLWRARPILLIMVLAAVLRLSAAIFAKGYGMHDDHFSVIELAQRWVDGHDRPSPTRIPKRNLLYAGAHFLLFKGLSKVSESLDFTTLQLAQFVSKRMLVTRRSAESRSVNQLWEEIRQNASRMAISAGQLTVFDSSGNRILEFLSG